MGILTFSRWTSLLSGDEVSVETDGYYIFEVEAAPVAELTLQIQSKNGGAFIVPFNELGTYPARVYLQLERGDVVRSSAAGVTGVYVGLRPLWIQYAGGS